MSSKNFKKLKIAIIFIILMYVFYSLSYPVISENLFPFRFEDDGEYYIKSKLTAFLSGVFLSAITLIIINKYFKSGE